jgi:hypothetical protein
MGSKWRIIENGRRKTNWPLDISGHLSNVIEVKAALREI